MKYKRLASVINIRIVNIVIQILASFQISTDIQYYSKKEEFKLIP